MKKIKFISPSLHGILDYMVDITLISVPLIFNFRAISDTVFWVPIAIGLSNLLYSLFTVYSRSLVPLIPFYLHLFFGWCYKITDNLFGRAPASQGRCITGFASLGASLGASHASPLHTPHAKIFPSVKK